MDYHPMESGETLLKKLDSKLSGLRGRLTPDTGMDKITWVRHRFCSSLPMRKTCRIS